MRFGQEFRNAQTPLWSSSYIAYDELKTLIKVACGHTGTPGVTPDFKGKETTLSLT